MNWIKVGEGITPPQYRVLICYCPEWSDLEYQVAIWDGKEFLYDGHADEEFTDYVVKWALFMEAD